MDLPKMPDVSAIIKEEPNPGRKLALTVLVWGLGVLAFLLGVFITHSFMSDHNTDKSKDAQISELTKQLVAKDAVIDFWQAAYHIKDSLYDDCGKQRYLDARQTSMSIDKRAMLNDSTRILSKKIVKKLK